MVKLNTAWTSSSKHFKQSGEFSATVKNSLDISGIDSSSDIDLDQTAIETFWCGTVDDKMYRNAGYFSSTITDSQAIGNPTGIDFNQIDTLITRDDGVTDKLVKQSGSFSATVKTSLDISAIETAPNGIADDGTDTIWSGNTGNKLYKTSGAFSATFKTSRDVGTVDTEPVGCDWTGEDTLWSGSENNKLYKTSGAFSATLKNSIAVGGIASPVGVSEGEDVLVIAILRRRIEGY
jgi:hypothetical protein